MISFTEKKADLRTCVHNLERGSHEPDFKATFSTHLGGLAPGCLLRTSIQPVQSSSTERDVKRVAQWCMCFFSFMELTHLGSCQVHVLYVVNMLSLESHPRASKIRGKSSAMVFCTIRGSNGKLRWQIAAPKNRRWTCSTSWFWWQYPQHQGATICLDFPFRRNSNSSTWSARMQFGNTWKYKRNSENFRHSLIRPVDYLPEQSLHQRFGGCLNTVWKI